jgi:hypothetical protein
MGTISITFTGASMEEVARLITAWAPPASAGASGATPAVPVATTSWGNAAAITRVMSGVHGAQSRRLLRRIAEAGLKGDHVQLSEALIVEFGVTGGTAFAGMIGPVNRRANAIMGRYLIDYPSADPKARIWQIAPDDARAVLAALGK